MPSPGPGFPSRPWGCVVGLFGSEAGPILAVRLLVDGLGKNMVAAQQATGRDEHSGTFTNTAPEPSSGVVLRHDVVSAFGLARFGYRSGPGLPDWYPVGFSF